VEVAVPLTEIFEFKFPECDFPASVLELQARNFSCQGLSRIGKTSLTAGPDSSALGGKKYGSSCEDCCAWGPRIFIFWAPARGGGL
jgi:hypothetical protein